MRWQWLGCLLAVVLAALGGPVVALEPASLTPSSSSAAAQPTDQHHAAAATMAARPVSPPQVSPGGYGIGSRRLLGFGFDPAAGLTAYRYTISCTGPWPCGPNDVAGLIWEGYTGHGASDWPGFCWRLRGCAACRGQ